MDNNNWRPIQGGEPPAMDTVDWRTQLQPDYRHRIVNKILDTLKKHLPFSGPEGLHELKKIAERFEEKIYTAATSQSDYLRKISLKMLTTETESQNTIPNTLQNNQVGNSNRPPAPGSLGMPPQVHNQAQSQPNQPQTRQQLLPQNIQNQVGVQSSLDSTAQTGHANGGDWQEEVFQKIKLMKDQYLPELSEMYQKIATKLQQHDSLPQPPKSEKFDKLKLFKSMLERCITFLQVSKSAIIPGYKEKIPHYEKQIINIINVNRPRKIQLMKDQDLHELNDA